MAKQVVTLYIDDTSLRLLVAKGKRIEKWADLPLKPSLVRDGVIADEAKVAAMIKELLKAQRVKTRKVIAGLSGVHCLFRLITLPQLPKAVLAEAVMREAERVMPVPVDQLYILWQIIPAPGEEILVFLAALPRNAADALIKTLRRAGVDPYLMDPAPLALARVVDRPTAIIADVQPTEVDIVVMVDRTPQLIRTLSLPGEAQSWQEKLAAVRGELDKTIKFYNSSHSENPLDPDTPIFVSGELAQESEASQSLTGELKYSVLPLSSPLECPKDLAPSQYMVNIGLALKEVLLPRARANRSVVNLNALPEVYRPKARSLAEILFVPAIMLGIGLLVPLVMIVQNTAADTASLHVQLNTTNQLLRQRQIEGENIVELEQKVAEAKASRDTFTAVLNNFEQQHNEVNGDLKVATSTLPDAIALSSIAHASSGLTVSGMAPGEEEVLTYARDLRTSGRFSQVVISTLKKTEDGMSFRFILTR